MHRRLPLLLSTLFFAACQAPAPGTPGARAWAEQKQLSCTAPATRYCAACTASCGCPQNQEAYCTPGRDEGPWGTIPGQCAQQAVCTCR